LRSLERVARQERDDRLRSASSIGRQRKPAAAVNPAL